MSLPTKRSSPKRVFGLAQEKGNRGREEVSLGMPRRHGPGNLWSTSAGVKTEGGPAIFNYKEQED